MNLIREMMDESKVFRLLIVAVSLTVVLDLKLFIRNATQPEPIRVDQHSLVFRVL